MKLEEEEERDLIRRYKAGDRRAGGRLIEAHRPFVCKVANGFARHTKLPVEDLIQEGCLGLIRGIELFDEGRGVRLLTYARWHIEAWIRVAIRRHRQGLVRMPKSGASDRPAYVSLDAPAPLSPQLKNHEIIADPLSRHDERFSERERDEKRARELRDALGELKPEERVLIERLWLAQERPGIDELARLLGRSESWVRSHEKLARRKLKKILAAHR